MALIIKSKLGDPPREPAPLVDDAPKATLLPTEAEVNQRSLDWWAKHGLDPNAKPKLCPYCRQSYLKPCAEDEHAACQNFQFAQKRKKNESEDDGA